MSRSKDKAGAGTAPTARGLDAFPVELRPSALWEPGRLRPPGSWTGHIPFAFWLIDMLRPARFVELGTHSGNSYFAFCQAVAVLGAGTKCFAVDTWQGDEHAGHYGEEIFTEVSRHNEAHYKPFSKLVRATFDEALAKFEDGSIDLLHIDGLHTYAGVKHDFETWLPKLTPNAVVLFHDTMVREHGFEVFRLWRELSARYPALEFVHSNGLGVISISSSPPEALKPFFDAGQSGAKRDAVREMFASLGQVVSARLIVAQEQAVRAEAHERLATLTTHYEAAMRRADELQQEALSEKSRADQTQQANEATARELNLHSLELIKAQEALRVLREELSDSGGRLEQALMQVGALTEKLSHLQERDAHAVGRIGAGLRAVRQKLGDTRSMTKETWDDVETGLRQAAGAIDKLIAERDTALADVGGLAKELDVVREAAAARQTELSDMHARLAAPRWVGKQFLWALRQRLGLRFGKRRVHATQSAEPVVDQAQVIRESDLFDTDYYLKQIPADGEAAADPVGHYLRTGASRGLDPNPLFVTSWVLKKYPDIASGAWNPLAHYILFGWREGRATSSEFDAGFYLRTHEDVARLGLEPLRHFLQNGRAEGRIATARSSEGSSFFPVMHRSNLGLVRTARRGKGGDDTRLLALLPAQPSAANAVETPRVDVIIPVYGGYQETRTCIESTLQHRASNHAFGELILVDDCGPEPRLREFLREVAGREAGVTLLVNDRNLGFIKSVNRGMTHSKRDILLLNADTEVNGNWLDRIARHAAVDGRVATVTAFSNNATICTFPDIGGSPELPFGKSLAELDQAFAQANAGRSVDLPTGVGFCMFISRKCLDELGPFDEAFGRGYGEETDYCQKALQRGWRNLLAGDVFVFHHGSVSFGASAAAEQLAGGAMMRERYPDYERSVSLWISKDPALPMRFAALSRLIAEAGRQVILHVLHPWGGGTEKQVAEIAERASDAFHHIVMITRRNEDGLSLALLLPDEGAWREYTLQTDALRGVAQVFKTLNVARVHVHHALEAMDEMQGFLTELGVPYDLSIHDYSLVCPRNNLISTDGQYCGEPDERGCLECLRKEPAPRARDIILWRHKGSAILANADRTICPTIDVAARIRKYVPEARVIAVPHEAGLYHPVRTFAPLPLPQDERIKVAALGVFAKHKGGEFLLACIELGKRKSLPISWSVIGWFPEELAERARGVRDVLQVTGPYQASEVAGLIAQADPHLVFFPQHCAETYSYTLSEAFESGRGILAPELGAFSERISSVAGCWAYDIEETPGQVLERIMTLRAHVFATGDSAGVPVFSSSISQDVRVDLDFYEGAYQHPQTRVKADPG